MTSPETEFGYETSRTRRSSSFSSFRGKKRRSDNSDMTYGESYPSARYRSNRDHRDNKGESRTQQIIASNLPMHVTDQVVRESLFHEFKKFGDVSIYLRGRGEERYASILYRNPDDFIEMKRYYQDRRSKLIIFERQVQLDFEGEQERISDKSYSPDSFSSVSPRRNFTKSSGRPFRGDFGRIDRDRDRYDDGSYHNRDNRGPRDQKGRNFGGMYRNNGKMMPEEEHQASRTLFVGNLEPSISAQELRRIFERYGVIEDVDVKRPAHPGGNTYAFVKFRDPDVATEAKATMHGQYIGRNQCKIGYGRSMPSTRLWVGGLGPWTSLEELTREFDRFGAIKHIDYHKGSDFAYVLYDSLDAASVAAREMQGYPLGGPEKKLKIDFASHDQFAERSEDKYDNYPDQHQHYNNRYDNYDKRQSREHGRNFQDFRTNSMKPRYREDKRQSYDRGFRNWPDAQPEDPERVSMSKDIWSGPGGKMESGIDRPSRRRTRSRSPLNSSDRNHEFKDSDSYRNFETRHSSLERRGRSPSRKRNRVERVSPSPDRQSRHSEKSPSDNSRKSVKEYSETKDETSQDQTTGKKTDESSNKAIVKEKSENGTEPRGENLVDIAKRFAVAWRGAFALKNSAFPVRMHLIGGNPELADTLLRGAGTGQNGFMKVLSINQRLRLDQPKLEEVSRRVNSAGASGHCILLGLPVAGEELELEETFQKRPLRSLVTYFKQKQAAGVIPIPATTGSSDTSNASANDGGVLHAFPPCEYSHQQLLKVAPNLGSEPSKDDHLVMILVRGVV